MMKKRLLLCALLLCILLTACSTAAETEPVSISFMHGWGGSGADHVGMRELFAAFEAENPDIHIVYDTSPDLEIVMEKAADLLAVDKAPSIISTNGNVQYVSNAKKKGVALDLTPYLKEDATFASDVSPQILQALQEPDGAVYTLPDAVEYIGYWYNASLFRQAGITDTGTPEGTVVPPRTWEEFWAACDALAQIAPQTGAVPLQMQVSQMGFFLGARLAGASEQALAFMQKEASVCRREDAELAVSELLRALSYDDMVNMFIENSDEPYAERIAREIDRGLHKGMKFETTTELRNTIAKALAFLPEKEQKDAVKKSCQRVFQALRIDVNSEFEVLYDFLEKLPDCLNPGARVAILTFHSGEDRLVKKFFKEMQKAGIYREVSRDVIRPGKEECFLNPRAHSTKLRWAIK